MFRYHVPVLNINEHISFQFEVIAQDSVPSPLTRMTTGTVVITVQFDNPPAFEAVNYTETILETHAVGSEVTRDIRAIDPNGVCV